MFKKTKYVLTVSFLIVYILTLTTTSTSAKTSEVKDISTFFDKTLNLKLKKYNIPNATIAVVKEGKIVYKKGFGFADIEKKIPVDPDVSLFRIGSTSKLITWTAVMQLVEEGKLDLDADVNNYLDFKLPPYLINSTEKTPTKPITLTHLMTHTPGFEDYPDKIFRLSETELLPLDEYVKKYLPARIFPSGEVAAYSNYGTALAGYIVERVSGLPFSDYVKKNIFSPLQMDNSDFKQKVTKNLAKPYRFIEGTYVQGNFEYLLPEPAGSMSSSANDMANFMLAHLNEGTYNGERILSPETIDRMHRKSFSHHPSLGGMSLGFMQGIFNEKNVLFHGGGTMLYSTGLYLLPKEEVGVFISYSGGNHFLHSEVFQEFMDAYFPAPTSVVKVPAEGSKERAGKYIGEYQMNRRSLTTAEKSSSLFIGTIKVNVDSEGYLLVTNSGETNSFVEVEPGRYQNLREGRTQDYFGPFRNIVFEKDPYGRIMLATDGPMTYSKAPVYETMSFTVVVLILSLLTVISSVTYWTFIRIKGLFRRKEEELFKASAQAVGIFSGIIVLVLIVIILASGDIDPVYQLPKGAYTPVSMGPILSLTEALMPIFTLLLVIFTALTWLKGFWQRLDRIHYSIFTLAFVALFWIFSYWNLFG